MPGINYMSISSIVKFKSAVISNVCTEWLRIKWPLTKKAKIRSLIAKLSSVREKETNNPDSETRKEFHPEVCFGLFPPILTL